MNTKSIDRISWGVLEILNSFNITDDNDIPLSYLMDLAADINRSLMRDEFKSGYNFDQFYSSLVREIKEVNSIVATVNNISFSSKKKLYYLELPELLTGEKIGYQNIKYLGSGDFSTEFSRLSLMGFNSQHGSTATAHMPIYTVVSDKAFVQNLPVSETRFLKLICLLADQRDEDGFDPEETDYKTASPYKLQMLMIKHVGVSFGVPADKIDDAQSALRFQYEGKNNKDNK